MVKIMYAVFFTGVLIWQWDAAAALYTTVKNRLTIRRSIKEYTSADTAKRRGKLGKHVMRLIEGADACRYVKSPELFIGFTIICGSSVFLLVYYMENIAMAAVCGATAGSIPYLALVTRLSKMRVLRSREGDILIHELLNNYKMRGCNMKEAVEDTIVSIEGGENSKRVLLNLAKVLNTATTKQDISEGLRNFRYAVNTAWGNALATDIFYGFTYGIKVDNALEDLQRTVTKCRHVLEHGRQVNNEAHLILKYLAPICVLLTVWCACRYFGFTVGKYLSYQFGTDTGFKWFMIMAALYTGALIINSLLSNEKMDI